MTERQDSKTCEHEWIYNEIYTSNRTYRIVAYDNERIYLDEVTEKDYFIDMDQQNASCDLCGKPLAEFVDHDIDFITPPPGATIL